MKKFFLIPVLLLSLFFFVSCVDDEDDDLTDTISGDTGNSDPSDTGSADTDTTPSDTTDTADSGYNPGGDTGADTGSADTGSPDTGTDTGSPDTGDSDTGDTAPAPVSCTKISSLKPQSLHYESAGIYRAEIQDALGNDSKDELEIIFQLDGDPKAKTYSLNYDPADPTTYNNGNYETCTECVSISQDISNGNPAKFLFQESGTLEITEVDSSNGIKGSLNAKLVEVLIKDGRSEPVANGNCVEIENLVLDNLCVSHCEESWECGDDGCGGICKTCEGENMGCNGNHQCVEYECAQITVNNLKLKSTSNQINNKKLFFYNDESETKFWLKIQGLSNQGETDLSNMTFLDNCNGKFSEDDTVGTLGWPEANSVCMYVNDSKFYFPNQGKINLSLDDKGNLTAAIIENIRLVETNTTTGLPVDGNSNCIEITNETLSYSAQ